MTATRPTPRRLRARLSAFTLIELLTVIAIIGILASIIVPTVGKVRQTARNAQCVSNLRQWAQAIQLYAGENKGVYFTQGRYPDDTSSSLSWASANSNPALWPYGRYLESSTNAFQLRFCPLYPEGYSGNPPVSYAITRPRQGNTIVDARKVPLNKVGSPSRFLLLIDTHPSLLTTQTWVSSLADLNARVVPTLASSLWNRHGGGLNAAFGDGHIRRVTQAEITAFGDDWTRINN